MTSDRGGRRALVVAHEPDGRACQVETRLLQRGWKVDNHIVTLDYERPDDPEPWPDWSDYDLVLPMGSIRSLTAKEKISSWIHTEADLVREAHAADIAMLGVCFGGQLIAEALGGSVEKAPTPEIGWYRIEPFNDVPIGPGPWFQWHEDRFHPPPDAEVLAINESGVQLFRIGRAVGTQFHPEVDLAHVVGFLTGADPGYLAKVGVDPHAMVAELELHEARNIAQCHVLVDWFLDDVAAFDAAM